MRLFPALLIAAVLVAPSLSAQAALDVLPHPKLMKGQTVVYRFPMPSPLPKGHDGPWVSDSGGRIFVEGVSPDSIIGFPPSSLCKAERYIENGKIGLVGISLNCDNKYRWIFVPIDSTSAVRAINAVLAPASLAERVMTDASERIRRVVFTGALASVPEATQSLLLYAARKLGFSPYISTRQFQGKTFLRVDLGFYPTEMNTARLNMNQRVSTALNRSLLSDLKTFGSGLRDSGTLDGISLRVSIVHRNFAISGSRLDFDRVEMYMQNEDIVQFSKAEITGQELIDRSVVLVNDNRTKLVLSDAL